MKRPYEKYLRIFQEKIMLFSKNFKLKLEFLNHSQLHHVKLKQFLQAS